MKVNVICVLVVVFISESILALNTVANTFKAIVDDLIKNHELKLRNGRFAHKDPNQGYKQNAPEYVRIFANFLEEFHESDKAIFERFKNLDDDVWKGHYTTLLYLSDELRTNISLKGTIFREKHSNLINQKNLKIIQDNYTSLLNWCSYLFSVTPEIQLRFIEKVRDLYLESLLLLADLNDHNLRKYEILFIYLFNELKRFNGAKIIHKNNFILNSYENFVYKHIKERGPQNENLPSYVQRKLDAIRNGMSGETQALKNEQFNAVSIDFINMYHYILVESPKDYSNGEINKQYSEFVQNYRAKSKYDNYDIIKSGHGTLLKIYADNRAKFSLAPPNLKTIVYKPLSTKPLKNKKKVRWADKV